MGYALDDCYPSDGSCLAISTYGCRTSSDQDCCQACYACYACYTCCQARRQKNGNKEDCQGCCEEEERLLPLWLSTLILVSQYSCLASWSQQKTQSARI